MKKRKVSILVELSIVSLLTIISILSIYTVMQLISLNNFSNNYEEDQLEDRYDEILYLLKSGYDIDINKLLKDDEYIKIVKDNKVIYETKSKLWNEVRVNNYINSEDVDIIYIDFDKYLLLNSQSTINNHKYNIFILKEEQIIQEFSEEYFSMFFGTLVAGIILSIIGGIYVSKIFVKRLSILSNKMIEVKKNGIKERMEISKSKDELDKVSIVFNSMMDDLEEAFNEQSRFVSDASHELKTPLTALKGHLSMIKRWGKNDKERLEKSLEICINESDRLTKIVNDLLILSKSEKEVINIDEIEEIVPDKLVYEIVENYKILNDRVKFNVFTEGSTIRMSENHLKQLLIIFIDNAIKYNDKEEVNIDISIDNDKIIVKDNGIGIPKEDLPYIMERFYKVDKSRVNNNSFGLGLSIANRIVNNYGGTISVESEVHKFTRIIVRFIERWNIIYKTKWDPINKTPLGR